MHASGIARRHPICILVGGVLHQAQIVILHAGFREVPQQPKELCTLATMSSQAGQVSKDSKNIESLELDNISEAEQVKVQSPLGKHESAFSAFEGDLGCTSLVEHEIPLLDYVQVRQKFRRILPSDYDSVKAHINQLLEIREDCSPYPSPIVLLKKKDGSLWMRVNYHQFNSKMCRDVFSD